VENGTKKLVRHDNPAMRHFVFRWAITTVSVMVAASVISGIRYDSATSLIGAALLLGILNAFLRPILLLLMAPLIILTLGIFIFVVNALMLLLVNQFVHGFHVDSFGSAFWGAILISIVSWMLSAFFRGSDGRVHPLTHHTQIRRVEGRVVGSSKPGEP
jgi:putative membrane protein